MAKRKISQKQKAALSKGHKILEEALKLQKAGGTKAIPAKKVYIKNIADCMKLAKKRVRKAKKSQKSLF